MNDLFIYGLPNCDSTQKKIKELKNTNQNFTFIDFNIHPATKEQITTWCEQSHWSRLLNKKSTTWKSLDEKTQSKITNEIAAIEIMSIHNKLIKRPIMLIDVRLV